MAAAPSSRWGTSRCLCLAVLLAAAAAVVAEGGDAVITWDDLSVPSSSAAVTVAGLGKATTTIVVAQDGTGHSPTPAGSRSSSAPACTGRRCTKPFVSLIGAGTGRTVVTWSSRACDLDASGHQVGTFNSASVAVEADYFCASHITFQNSAPAAPPGAVWQQAVALRLSGDKTVLYRCRVLGTQDTLFDNIGRHYFYNCHIQGSIDFISGDARSLYQGCTLHAVATSYGAIAASQRSSPADDSGFSFVGCRLTGTGMLYLGRAWGRYARVVYSYCDLSGIVVPEGWSDWGDESRTKTVMFGEYSCKGPGASTSQRVPWSRTLTYEEARPFLGLSFIDGEEWLKL